MQYTTDAGREVAFADDAAFEAATDWYNSPHNTKRDLIDDYLARMGDGAIFADADCHGEYTRLASDWADLCMAAWARDNCGPAPFVWRW